MQYQPNASQISTPPAPKAQYSTPLSDKVKGKVRECPKCGALLSKKEKVCSICGEAMPKKPRNAKTALISMSIAICLLLCSTVYFMLEMFKGNQTIDELNGTIAEWKDNYQQLYEEYTLAKESSEYYRHWFHYYMRQSR